MKMKWWKECPWYVWAFSFFSCRSAYVCHLGEVCGSPVSKGF